MQRIILTPDNHGSVRDVNFFIQSFYKEGHVVETDSYFLENQFALGIEDIIKALKEIFPQSNINDCGNEIVLESPQGALSFDYSSRGQKNATFIRCACFTLEPAKKAELFLKFTSFPKFVYPEEEPSGHFVVFDYFTTLIGKTKRKEHRMDTSSMNHIRDDLYPGIDVEKMVNSFLGSNENILILVGLPGTGKTTFMKRVLQAMSFKKNQPRALYTKDMSVLESPEFWSDSLPNINPSFLVLDDLDKELTPRVEVESNLIVNQLLSLSNGLFENKMKIIITTNLVDEGIDSAVLRPGRCFDVINLPFLAVDYAKDLWLNVDNRTQEEWDSLFPAEMQHVTQALYMANLESLLKDTGKDYLTDKSISVRDKYLGV